MNEADLILADKIISHQVALLRYSASEKNRIMALFAQMEKELKAKLASDDITEFTRQRLEKLLEECTAVIESFYGKMQNEVDATNLAKTEVRASTNIIASIGLEASIPTAVTVKALIADTLLQGAPLADWWAKQAEDTAFKFMAQVRQGVAQGETLQQIITRIVGSKKKGIPGIMDISRRNALTLVHDSVMQITNDARMAVYRENDDIIKGVRWLATLDGHTCLRCIPRDGKMWTLDGKPLNTNLTFSMPPAHPACRCVLCPVTKTMKELGIDVEELPKGTRASDLGQIPADTSFDAFLARHSDEYLNKLLGPGRAELYRKGKITLNQLID